MTEQRQRIYLDNAATSFPKPSPVYDAVNEYQTELGGAVGRGATQVGARIQSRVDRCRNRLAKLLDVASQQHLFFTFNGTDSLNLALHGILTPGDHVVTSCWEHNSVLRPLHELSSSRKIATTFLGGNELGQIDLKQLEAALAKKTKLVCITHASNVTGIIQPVKQVVELAHAAGAYVLLDAAQTVGHLPVSMQELNVDFLACPGHKGLLGPLGTGLLAIRPGLEVELPSHRQGGTGTTSESESQPESLPGKYESGNHNAPGLFGLEAALAWLENETVEKILQQGLELTKHFIEGLRALPSIETYFTDGSPNRVSLVSLNTDKLEPQVLCSLLDEHFGIETRSGLHCAPRAHAEIGTLTRGGTTRFSFGAFNTPEQVDIALEAIGQIVASF